MNKRTVVVTGASRGIGAETAKLAGARGYRVCVNYRNDKAAADAVVEAIRAAGSEAFAFKADTSDEAAIVAMFDETMERFGQIDALVNNAGIYGDSRPIDEITVTELRQMFDVNVIGYFVCAREAVRRMSPAKGGQGGSIVNVSSVAAVTGGTAGRTHYGATKGAIGTFTIGLAKEVADLGITVNEFAPGLTDTDLNPPGRVESVAPLVPLKRAGTPQEMAAGILWLLSQEARYCTGSRLTMSGGR